MGFLVEGKWVDQWYDTKATGGKFVRADSSFRNWITADGSKGPSGAAGFKAEANRYHLYISYACPWAHRTLIFRKLNKLEDMISLSVVDHHMGAEGWIFSERDGAIPDPINHASHLHKIYTAAQPDFSGRVTVPVLWDKQQHTIVSNESSEIIRMFNSAFDGLTGSDLDFYPEQLRPQIDEVNDRIYNTVNNGVYKCGFATKQEIYEEEFAALFDTLDMLDERLAKNRYLVGDTLTEADWRLFVTLVRFDPVYVGHFKCNKRQIAEYPNLSNYLRELYQYPGIAETVNFKHIKHHYYGSHDNINPHLVVPLGPQIDLTAPHNRSEL